MSKNLNITLVVWLFFTCSWKDHFYIGRPILGLLALVRRGNQNLILFKYL